MGIHAAAGLDPEKEVFATNAHPFATEGVAMQSAYVLTALLVAAGRPAPKLLYFRAPATRSAR